MSVENICKGISFTFAIRNVCVTFMRVSFPLGVFLLTDAEPYTKKGKAMSPTVHC